MFTDSHCHLAFPEFQEKLPEIRAAMVQAQVDRALCICTTLEEFPTVHGLALAHDNFWATAGVHPDNEVETEPTLADLLHLGSLPRVVGIGETGLDYYRLAGRSIADMEWQRDRFRTHIRAARELGKPLVIPAVRPTTRWRFCERRVKTAAQVAPVASFTASPRPPRWRGPRWTWAFTSRFQAF